MNVEMPNWSDLIRFDFHFICWLVDSLIDWSDLIDWWICRGQIASEAFERGILLLKKVVQATMVRNSAILFKKHNQSHLYRNPVVFSADEISGCPITGFHEAILSFGEPGSLGLYSRTICRCINLRGPPPWLPRLQTGFPGLRIGSVPMKFLKLRRLDSKPDDLRICWGNDLLHFGKLHSNGISPCCMGNTSSKGPFSVAMLVYQFFWGLIFMYHTYRWWFQIF